MTQRLVRLLFLQVVPTGITLALAMACNAPTALSPAPPPSGVPGDRGEFNQLPNGWRVSPVGKLVETHDMILNLVPGPDGRAVVGLTSGYHPHELVVIDGESDAVVQRIEVATSWYGLAWHPDGKRLYVSGGNTARKTRQAENPPPIYVFGYQEGRLSEEPIALFTIPDSPNRVFWSGLVHHPTRDLLYAANRTASQVIAFDSKSGREVARVSTGANPYALVLDAEGGHLYVSNWGGDSVSVFSTEPFELLETIPVGDNPNDMVITSDGRLFIASSNDNRVYTIDTQRRRAVEAIVTSLYPDAPQGSTPNALALSPDETTLYVANADNNNVCVVDIQEQGESVVLGFIPAGWYPSAVAMIPNGKKLYIGNSKGGGSMTTLTGSKSPLEPDREKRKSVKDLTRGSIQIVEFPFAEPLDELTERSYATVPYLDALLKRAAPPPPEGSVIPREVGLGSPIRHVIYILKENRTYDQVFGDLPQGNGDPRLTIFGREVTPNHHALAEQFVLFDNLYADAEVSQDGHQWSNAAYATDFVEKRWPHYHGKKGGSPDSNAVVPASGYIWDVAAEKGLTYRSYGEMARWYKKTGEMRVFKTAPGLNGHLAPGYKGWHARDFENAAAFIEEFDRFEENYDSPDPEKRLPNFIVMALPEDHTLGSLHGAYTPRASVASNDLGLGLIIERVSHSRYWPELAVFVIEDDAQDGPDHVDARRTVGLVASPFARRGIVDSTFYSTSSMLRSMELLLGLPPMSQYDAAATPMYAAMSKTPDLTPYDHLEPSTDIFEMNDKTAWGGKASAEMDFSYFDLTPMFELNEIVWKSVKGPDSEMPLPIHRFNRAETYTRP